MHTHLLLRTILLTLVSSTASAQSADIPLHVSGWAQSNTLACLTGSQWSYVKAWATIGPDPQGPRALMKDVTAGFNDKIGQSLSDPPVNKREEWTSQAEAREHVKVVFPVGGKICVCIVPFAYALTKEGVLLKKVGAQVCPT